MIRQVWRSPSLSEFGFSLPDGWANQGAVTLLEEPQDRNAPMDLMPFEVRSWRLGKA